MRVLLVGVGTVGEAIARLRIYQVGQRHYQLILEGPKDFVDSDEANQFFDSFKLIM
jgi:hypothetical protein